LGFSRVLSNGVDRRSNHVEANEARLRHAPDPTRAYRARPQNASSTAELRLELSACARPTDSRVARGLSGGQSVFKARRPFQLPAKLEPALARLLAYWRKLERAEAEMPFWDDVKLSALPKALARKIVLMDVLPSPVRFRFAFGSVGEDVVHDYGGDLSGKFLDEIEPRSPLQLLQSQCGAVVELRAPAYYRHAADRRKDTYARLILPMWGDGRVSMLLGGFA